jgi:hypothetical protein
MKLTVPVGLPGIRATRRAGPKHEGAACPGRPGRARRPGAIMSRAQRPAATLYSAGGSLLRAAPPPQGTHVLMQIAVLLTRTTYTGTAGRCRSFDIFMALVERDESVFIKVRLADVVNIEKIEESFWFGNPPAPLRNIRQGFLSRECRRSC